MKTFLPFCQLLISLSWPADPLADYYVIYQCNNYQGVIIHDPSGSTSDTATAGYIPSTNALDWTPTFVGQQTSFVMSAYEPVGLYTCWEFSGTNRLPVRLTISSYHCQ